MPMHSSKLSFRGLDLQVDYCYSPGRPGCHTLPNGDPGYPEELPEVEISAVRLWNSPHDLSEVLCEKFMRELGEKLLELEASSAYVAAGDL